MSICLVARWRDKSLKGYDVIYSPNRRCGVSSGLKQNTAATGCNHRFNFERDYSDWQHEDKRPGELHAWYEIERVAATTVARSQQDRCFDMTISSARGFLDFATSCRRFVDKLWWCGLVQHKVRHARGFSNPLKVDFVTQGF